MSDKRCPSLWALAVLLSVQFVLQRVAGEYNNYDYLSEAPDNTKETRPSTSSGVNATAADTSSSVSSEIVATNNQTLPTSTDTAEAAAGTSEKSSENSFTTPTPTVPARRKRTYIGLVKSDDTATTPAGAPASATANSTLNLSDKLKNVTAVGDQVNEGDGKSEDVDSEGLLKIKVNPGALKNFCKFNLQGAVAGDTVATSKFQLFSAYLNCDGPDNITVVIHSALRRYVSDWTGVRIVPNWGDNVDALITFIGPAEVAFYNSTVLFLREVDPQLAFIAIKRGINATMTRINFFDNSGGLAPVVIDDSNILMGSVGFVRNYGPQRAGGMWIRGQSTVTATRCAWDTNGLPESLPYVGAVWVDDQSHFTLNGGGITNSWGSLSGSFLVGNGSSIVIQGTHMANNTALSPGSAEVAGAIWIRNSNASINGTSLAGNRANVGSGAVRVSGKSYVQVSFSDIRENQSDNDGGAISISNFAGNQDVFVSEDAQSIFKTPKAALRMRYMSLKMNYGVGIKCKQGGVMQVRDCLFQDNYNTFDKLANVESTDCDFFEQDGLQFRSTGEMLIPDALPNPWVETQDVTPDAVVTANGTVLQATPSQDGAPPPPMPENPGPYIQDLYALATQIQNEVKSITPIEKLERELNGPNG